MVKFVVDYRKFKTRFHRPWLTAGILGLMVLLIIAADGFSGLTAQAFSAGCSSPNFLTPTSFATGENSTFVAAGDFNNDTKPDLVVANSYYFASDVSLLLGDGTGGFGAPKHFSVGRNPIFVVVGDFNGDHNLDFATANSNYTDRTGTPGTVSVRLGDGKGDFAPAINTPAGVIPSSLATGDFNNDGRLDLAVGNAGQGIINEGPFIVYPGSVTILLGDGTGGFSQSQNSEFGPLSAVSIAAGDLNGDGNLDLAVGLIVQPFSSGQTPHISILIGNGAGKFTVAQDITLTTRPLCVLLGDFNNDGKLDLVNVDNLAGGNSKTITIRLGNGTGSFGAGSNIQVASDPEFAVAGDFNLDGNLDLVVTNGVVYFMLGDGNGGFGAPTEIAHGFETLATGDFNNDGNLDLALMFPRISDFSFPGSVTILLNNCGAPTTTPGPKLLALEQSNTAAAGDSVFMIRDPFPFNSTINFGSDQRTRIVLFAMNIDLQAGENAAAVTVHAENSQHAIVSVPAEYVGRVAKFSWMTQVNVRLPDELMNGGDFSMSVIYHGIESNKVVITVKPPAN